MSESRTVVRVKGIRAEAWRGKGGLHNERRQVPRRTSKKSIPRRSRRKHERVGESKSSPGRSAESWLHSITGQTEMGKKIGRRRARS